MPESLHNWAVDESSADLLKKPRSEWTGRNLTGDKWTPSNRPEAQAHLL